MIQSNQNQHDNQDFGLHVERIVNRDFAEGFLEEIKCPICYQVLFKPRICSECEKAFCYACLKQMDKKKNCPCCRQIFKLKSAPKILLNLISKLILFCVNKEKGCEKKISYDSLEKHQILECLFLTIKCTNHPCEEEFYKKDSETHKQVCLYELVVCTQCQNIYRRKDLEIHMLQTCDYRKVQCKYCNSEQPFIHHDDHVRDCPDRFKTCEKCQTKYTVENFVSHTKAKCMKKQKHYFRRKYDEECSKTVEKEIIIQKQNNEIEELQNQIDQLKFGENQQNPRKRQVKTYADSEW